MLELRPAQEKTVLMVSMKPSLYRVVCFALAAAVATSALASDVAAQTAPTRVEQLRLDPAAHANQVRTVEGVVDRLVNRAGASTPAFYLEDDYGHQILVVPFDSPPARGDRLTVTGVITLDSSGDPLLTMLGADGAGGETGAEGQPMTPPAELGVDEAVEEQAEPAVVVPVRPVAQAAPNLFARLRPWLLPVGGILGFIFFAAYFYKRGRAAAPPPLVTAPIVGRQDVDFATSALWPESDQEFDGRTLRFVRPDSTVRLMPGRLEVIGGGDAGEEIRFVTVQGEDGARTEMMLGRASGDGPTHVQLKQKTVSRTHAVIRHRHGEWLIENLSTTNPTVLNDEVLGVKERLLTDGDRIEMGEVIFRFRET